jgi:hypothetical protein
LSYGLNDSGLAIPALMLALVAATGVYAVAAESDQPLRSPPGSTASTTRDA